MQRKSITSEDRKRLVDARIRNENFLLVAEQLGIKKSSANCIISQWRKSQNLLSSRLRGKRKSKVTPEIEKDIVDFLEKNSVATLQEIKNFVNQRFNTLISINTISNYLHRKSIPFKKQKSISFENKKLIMEARSRNEDFLLLADQLGINRRYVYNIISRWKKAERMSMEKHKDATTIKLLPDLRSNSNDGSEGNSLESLQYLENVVVENKNLAINSQPLSNNFYCQKESTDIQASDGDYKSPIIREPMETDNMNVFLINQCESNHITVVDPVIPNKSPHHKDVVVKKESVATEFVNISPQADPVNFVNSEHIMPNFIEGNCFLILQNLPKLVMPGDKIIRVKAIQNDPCQTLESLSYEDVTHLVQAQSLNDNNPEIKSERLDNHKYNGFVSSQVIEGNNSKPNLLTVSNECHNTHHQTLKQEYSNLSHETKKRLVDAHARGEDFVKLAAQIGISNKTACNVIRKWYLPEKGDNKLITVNKLKRGSTNGPKITKDIGKHLISFIEDFSLATMLQMQTMMVDKYNIKVSFQTISKFLHGQCISLKSLKNLSVDVNGEEVKQKRYEYVRRLLDDGVSFDRCVYIDKLAFNLWLGQRGQRWTNLWLFMAASVHGVIAFELVEGGFDDTRMESFIDNVAAKSPADSLFFVEDDVAALGPASVGKVCHLPPMSDFLSPLAALFSEVRAEVKEAMFVGERAVVDLEQRIGQLKTVVAAVVGRSDRPAIVNHFFDTHKFYLRCLEKRDIVVDKHHT